MKLGRCRPPNVHPAIWLVSGLKETSDGCLEWQGGRTPAGYGQMVWARGEQTRYTHRLAWEMAKGPVPPGQCVLHSCDNPPCCNPEHLGGGLGVAVAVLTGGARAPCVVGRLGSVAALALAVPHVLGVSPEEYWTTGGTRACLVCRRQYDRQRRPRTPKKVPMPAGVEKAHG